MKSSLDYSKQANAYFTKSRVQLNNSITKLNNYDNHNYNSFGVYLNTVINSNFKT